MKKDSWWSCHGGGVSGFCFGLVMSLSGGVMVLPCLVMVVSWLYFGCVIVLVVLWSCCVVVVSW